MNILNNLRANTIIKKFITHVTLLGYLCTIFTPVMVHAGSAASEKYDKVEVYILGSALLRNPEFDDHLSEMLLKGPARAATAEPRRPKSLKFVYEPTWQGKNKAWNIGINKTYADGEDYELMTVASGANVNLEDFAGTYTFNIVDGKIHVKGFRGGWYKSYGTLYIDEGANFRGITDLHIVAPDAQVYGHVSADMLRMDIPGTLELCNSQYTTGSLIAFKALQLNVGTLIVRPPFQPKIHARIYSPDITLCLQNLENHGMIGGKATNKLKIDAQKIVNRSSIEAQESLTLTSNTIDNEDGRIHGAGKVDITTGHLKNDRGSISGVKETMVTMDDATADMVSLSNKEGQIGEKSNTTLRFLKRGVVTALGLIRGAITSLIDQSGSTELKLENGELEGDDYVSISGIKIYAPHVNIIASTLYLKVLNIMLDPQSQCGETIVHVQKGQNIHWTHPFATTGTLEFSEQDLNSELTMEEIMEGLYGKDGLLEIPATQTIHLNHNIQANGGLGVYAPTSILRIGENKADAPTPEVRLDDTDIEVYANTFDLEKALLVATKAFVHAPMGIKIGRLIKDVTRELLPDINMGIPWNTRLRWKIEDPVWNGFIGQDIAYRQGAVPLVVRNNASFLVKDSTEFKGPLYHQGTLETDDLTLDSPKESACEGSLTIIRNDLFLAGVGNLLLKPFMTLINWDLYFNNYTFGWFEYMYPASDPAEFRIYGKIEGESTSTIVNRASILHAHEKTPEVKIITEDFNTHTHRKHPWRHPQCTYYRNIHYFNHMSSWGFNKTIFKPIFPAQTSFDTGVVLPADGTALAGHVSSPLMLISVGERGLVLGSPNPYYIPPKPPVTDLAAKPFSAVTVTVNPDLLKAMAEAAKPRFYFKMRERFWFDDAKAQMFCEDIQDHQVVLTRAGVYRKLDTSVFTLSPHLLVERVRDACQETLMRGYIEHGKAINEETVKELHRNATEYLRGTDIDAGSMALVLASQASKTALPTKPLIFYEEVMNEDGIEELVAKVYFPPSMIEEVRTKRGGHIHTRALGIFPEGTSPLQLLEYFKSSASLCSQVAKLLLPPEMVNQYLEDIIPTVAGESGSTPDSTMALPNPDILSATGGSGDMPSAVTKGTVDVYADITAEQVAIIGADALRIHGASIKAKNVFLASLNDVVSVITEKKRLHAPGRMWEEVDKRASIVAEEFISIYAGKDIVMQGVITKSGEDTYIQALGRIYDIPVTLLSESVHHHRHKKKSITTVTRESRVDGSTHTAGGTYTVLAGTEAVMQAVKVKARDAYIAAQDSVRILDGHNTRQQDTTVSKKGGTFSRSSHSHETSVSSTSVGSVFDIDNVLEIFSPNSLLTNTAIRATRTLLNTPGGLGVVRLAMGVNEYFTARTSHSSSMVWQTSKQSSELHRVHTAANIVGDLVVNASQLTIEGTATSPSTALGTRIRLLKGEVVPFLMQDHHESHATSHTGPTAELSALVAIGVGLATGGWGSGFASTIGVESAVGTAALGGAIGATASTVAVGTLNAQGNILEGIASLGDRNALQNIAMAAATAGIAKVWGGHIGLQSNPTGFAKHAQHAMVHAGSGAIAGVAIGGQRVGDALSYAARGFAAGTVGGVLANNIGEWYGANPEFYWGHKAAHFVAGGLMGGLQYGEDGILGGAMGAMTAEIAMEAMVDKRETQRNVVGSIRGRPLEERLLINPESGRALIYDATRHEVQGRRDFSQFLGATAGLLAGGNVNAASLTASNAVDHNFIPLLVAGGFALWEAYELKQAYNEGGLEGLAVQAGTDAALAVTGGMIVKKFYQGGKVLYRGGRALLSLGRTGAAAEAAAAGTEVLGVEAVAAVGKTVTEGSKRTITYVSKEQPWTVRPGQEWKHKVIGRAQKTGTTGHDVRSYREAIRAAKSAEVESVYLNRGIRKASGHPIARPNTRPDVTTVTKDGRIHQIEVPSKTDFIRKLDARMEATQLRLPEHMRGKDRISRISGDGR